MKKTDDRRSMWMLICAMLIFGTIGIFRRQIPMSSAVLAFSRGILGGTFLLVFIKWKRKGAAQMPAKGDILWLIAAGAVMGINWILLFEAYNYTSVAAATLCYYMQPTIVMLLSPIIFKEPLTRKKSICAVVAVIGMIFVSGAADGGMTVGHGSLIEAVSGLAEGGNIIRTVNHIAEGVTDIANLRGILLGLGAAVFYSGVVIMNKKAAGIDPYQKTTIELLSAGAVMVPYLFLTKDGMGGGFGVPALLLLIVIGVVHTGIAYVLYFGSMDGLKVQTVAILSYIDPVSALLFSAVFLGEWLSVKGMIGAVLILGSAIISERQTSGIFVGREKKIGKIGRIKP